MKTTYLFRLPAALLLVAGLLSGSAHGQVTPAQIDSLVALAQEHFTVAGFAIGVVKDGRVVHAKGYGVRSVTTGEPVDEHTNFAIASNSKAFTTTALALLVEEGRLSWDDPVRKHIPEFKMYDPYVTEHFTIRDLLTHRSGLGLGVGDLMFFPDGGDFTIDDLLASFQHFKPVSEFRTKFDYDNLLYTVAGEVIFRVTGQTWEAFVADRIFRPLDMDRSFPGLAEVISTPNLATPHSTDTGELLPIANFQEGINGAAGGIFSNVDDMNRWMLLQLNEGRYGPELRQQLFSPEQQRQMWTIHTVMPASGNPRYRSHFAGYGLGWFLTDVLGNMKVEHTGGLPGMLSIVTLIPDLELGIVILTNTSEDGGALFGAIDRSILDAYLGLKDSDWIERLAARFAERQTQGDSVTQRVWATVAAADAGHLDPADYIGVYEDPWFGKVEVFPRGAELWIKSHRSPKLTGRMHYYRANTFAIRWDYRDMNADAFATFQLDEEGRAQALKMKGISPNIDFSFDFHDLDLRRLPPGR